MSVDDQVRQLYAAYQDWRARVYGALDRLSADELDTLVVRQARFKQLGRSYPLGPPASCRQTLAGRMPAVPGATAQSSLDGLLGRLLRGDTGQLLDRIDAALARLANEKGRGMNDNDTHNDVAAAGEKPR